MNKRPNKSNDKHESENGKIKNEGSIPVISSLDDHEINKKGKSTKRSGKRLKPFIIASLSAVAIGIVLGSIMLNLFTSIENGDDQKTLSTSSSQTNESDIGNNEGPDETTETIIESMNAYVVQGGVFKEKENAEEWLNTFKNAGHDAIIWNKADGYYLMAGVAATKEIANEKVRAIKESELDAFSKQWSTEPVKSELSEEEKEWFTQFQEKWNLTLETSGEQQKQAILDWQKLLEDESINKDSYKPLQTKTNDFLQKSGQMSDAEIRFSLLEIWKLFDEALDR
ncbi:hypothetical protein ACLIBG_04440 [Virgibacillus sp. W0181]|uniref:hypothetical protein n=1 Tax=Virgibacillus sp. W0181 TaxID=3391581 RepID=UPI003F451F32